MLRALAALVLLAAGFGLASGQLERWVIYPFSPLHSTPAAAGAPSLSETRLDTPDGETLVLWVARPRPGKPVILYFHGNAGNLANRAWRFEQLTKRGYGLVAPGYRGSSGSTGRPAEPALRTDAALVLGAVPDLTGSDRVIVYGESLGTGVAVATATQPGAPGDTIRAVVLESPYLSIPAVARSLYPKLEPLIATLTNTWDSAAAAPNLRAPLLVLHGAADELIPPNQGRALFDLAGSRDKAFVTVPEASHTRVWKPAGQRALYAFLARF